MTYQEERLGYKNLKMSEENKNIVPYIYVKERGFFDTYHYLHIVGGSGGKKGMGGQHKFYLFYAQPDVAAMRDISPEFWCEKMIIPCGVGDTIEEAHNDFLIKAEETPLKNL